MFGRSGLQVDGRLFALEQGEDLVLKLPADEVSALLASGDGAPFGNGGRVMREWVAVRPGADWSSLAERARAFVAGG